MYRRYRSNAWSTFWSVLGALGVIVLVVVVVGLLVLGVGAVANTGGDNYTGRGNHFEIEATVTDTTYHSVFISKVRIISARGQAHDWFGSAGNIWSANHFELQDHYTDADGHTHVIGMVRYQANIDVGADIFTLEPGMRIRAWGTIGDTQNGKTTQTEARFKTIVILTGS